MIQSHIPRLRKHISPMRISHTNDIIQILTINIPTLICAMQMGTKRRLLVSQSAGEIQKTMKQNFYREHWIS